MTTWPEYVPVLTADDFCRRRFTSEDGCRHCLRGWLNVVFHHSTANCKAVIAIRKQIDTGLMQFNDNPRNSFTTLANVWNSAMSRLGYTEIHEVDE